MKRNHTEAGRSPSGRRRPLQRRAEATIDHILSTTERIVRERGLLDLSTNLIAREASVSVGSIYQYFPDKEAILVALYQRALDRMWVLLQSVADDLGPSLTLEDLFDTVWLRISQVDLEEFAPYARVLTSSGIEGILDAERAHNLRVTEWLVDLLIRTGAQLPRERLRKLATFTYCIYSAATWEAATVLGEVDSDIESWRDTAVRLLLRDVLIK